MKLTEGGLGPHRRGDARRDSAEAACSLGQRREEFCRRVGAGCKLRRLYTSSERARKFRQVQVGEYGTDIVWPGGVDMSADTL